MAILQLLRQGAINEPAITLSPWLLRNRNQYQEQLFRLSQSGDWNPWIDFFCRAVIHQCEVLVEGAERLDRWLTESVELVNQRGWSGRILGVIKGLAVWPSLTVTSTADQFKMTAAAATSIINHLCEVGILTEMTGRSYGRVFGAQEVISIVESI
jgi:Fic family protein